MPRKGESIYKRKDGRWEGRFRKYRDANGKIKYGYVYARSYTEVKIKLNKIKQEITIPAESGTADIIVRTFSEVVKEWITYKTPLLKESSVAKYTNIIKGSPVFQASCDQQRNCRSQQLPFQRKTEDPFRFFHRIRYLL